MYKLFFSIFFISSFVIGQEKEELLNVVVDYDMILNDTTDVESSHYALKYQLVSNGNKSYQNLLSYIDTTLYDRERYPHEFNSEQFINKPNYYKDLTENEVIYGAVYNFKDSGKVTDFPTFKYIEGQNVKTVFGYKCKQLFVSFRGRDYEVYYTPDLASYKDGPWKFMGAPGLILEVKSFDNAVCMKAKCVQFSKDFKIKSMPKEWYQRIGMFYGDFVERRCEWRDKVKAKFEAEDPMSYINIPYRSFEIYHPYFIDNHR